MRRSIFRVIATIRHPLWHLPFLIHLTLGLIFLTVAQMMGWPL